MLGVIRRLYIINTFLCSCSTLFSSKILTQNVINALLTRFLYTYFSIFESKIFTQDIINVLLIRFSCTFSIFFCFFRTKTLT